MLSTSPEKQVFVCCQFQYIVHISILYSWTIVCVHLWMCIISKETWHSPSHRDRLTASRWNWPDNGKICHGNTEREKKREILRVKTKRRKMRNVMEKLVKRRRSSQKERDYCFAGDGVRYGYVCIISPLFGMVCVCVCDLCLRVHWNAYVLLSISNKYLIIMKFVFCVEKMELIQ